MTHTMVERRVRVRETPLKGNSNSIEHWSDDESRAMLGAASTQEVAFFSLVHAVEHDYFLPETAFALKNSHSFNNHIVTEAL